MNPALKEAHAYTDLLELEYLFNGGYGILIQLILI